MRIIVRKASHAPCIECVRGEGLRSCHVERKNPFCLSMCVCVCGLCVQLAVVNLFSIKLYFIQFSMASIFAMFQLS